MTKKSFFKRNLKGVVVAACLAGSVTMFAQETITVHFTEASKRIVIPDEYGTAVLPEIHDGLIAISVYGGNLMYVSAETGEYVFGSETGIESSSFFSPYFSGGVKSARLKEKLVLLYPDGKYRYFALKDNTGKVIDASIADFRDGYALVHKGSSLVMGVKQVFVDKNGKEVFPALASTHKGTFPDQVVYPLRDNRRVFYDAEKKRYGYADEKGNIVVKAQFGKALDFSEGMAAVGVIEDENAYTPTYKWGFIDVTGKMVIPATYKLQPGRFSEGLAVVRIGNAENRYETNYIDKTGKRMMAESQSWRANEFHNGLAWVAVGCDELFLIDKTFKKVLDLAPTKYFNICDFNLKRGEHPNEVWGFDFPDGWLINRNKIFAPDGTLRYQVTIKGRYGGDKYVTYTNRNDLLYCEISTAGMENVPSIKEPTTGGTLPCFINLKGEIVYYFEKRFEGYEGPAPVEIK